LNPAQPANAAPVRSGFAICPSTCESRSGELFLHRVVISRSAGPQLQGGDPGFVKLTGPSSLEFPDYDANFMYRTLGNITKNPKIGLLFMAFDRKTYRIRINGRASTRGDAESLGRHWGAKAVIRVECLDRYPNCPRYVPNLATSEGSIYVPRPGQTPPAPEWKRLPAVAPLLPDEDRQGAANGDAEG
jgi:hypothetical protein